MVKIYHNPRCSKSREGLAFLKNHTSQIEVIDYMQTGISFNELKYIIDLLKISPKDLIRTQEAVWKENYKNKNLSDDELIQAMADEPKLIQRPIIINNNKAVLGRPADNIKLIL